MKIAITALISVLVLIVAFPSAAFLFAPANFGERDKWLRVASYSYLPEDGAPAFISIRFSRQDGWTRTPEETIGHVFLRRIVATGEVVALKTLHSRGSSVVYDVDMRLFRCLCWGVEFDLNGMPVKDGHSDMAIQRVDVKVQDGEVFVRRPSDE